MDTELCVNCWRTEDRHVAGACILSMDNSNATLSDHLKYTPETDKDVLDWVETPRVDDHTNPEHYTTGRRYETWDVIIDWDLSYLLGNVVKYVSRAGRKGEALADLIKARNYIEKAIEGEGSGA